MDTGSLDTKIDAFVVTHYGIFSTVNVDTVRAGLTRKFIFYASTQKTFKWVRKSPKQRISI